MRIRIKTLMLVGVLAMVGLAGVVCQDVGAVTVPSDSRLEQMMMYQGVYGCYIGGAMKQELMLSNYENASSLLENGEISVPLITSANNSSDSLKCKDLLGNGGYIFKNVTPPVGSDNNTEATRTFVDNMGYVISSSLSDDKCYAGHYYYKMTDSRNSPEQSTNTVCQSSDKKLATYSIHDEENVFGVEDDGSSLCFIGIVGYSKEKHCKNIGENELSDSFLNDVIKGNTNCKSDLGCVLEFYNSSYIHFTDIYPTSPLNLIEATKEDNAYNSAINFLSKSEYEDLQDIKILDDKYHLDERALYQSYVVNYYHANVDCGSSDGDTVQWLDKDSVVKPCNYTQPSLHDGDTVTGVKEGLLVSDKIKFGDVITGLNNMREEYDERVIALYADYIEAGFSTSILNSEGGNILEDCEKSGAAKSIGWIVCPILGWMSDAASDIYTDYVEPSLQVSPTLFNDNNDDYGVWDTWSVFRNIANIFFAILLLVVIVSQLTGVGIDNYGIKKILPRLIVMAILVNLSYLICIICVDLSNIIGNGLQSMFDGFSDQIRFNDNPELDSAATGTAITAVSLLAGVGGVFAVVFNPAILLALLVSALGVVISILFLFLLLAGRKAVIIVWLVISPLAMVCYTLPNTKKYFDKWLNIWKVMLFLYPICGLLVGGGNFVSKLFLSVGAIGPFEAITAMIIGVLPIFFIPHYVESAISALGYIGTKMSGAGKRFGGMATKGAMNTGLYKNAKQASLERKTRFMAGMDKDGRTDIGWRRALGNIISGGKRSRQRSGLQYQKMISDRGSLSAVDEPDFMLETLTNNEMKRIVASGDINDEGKLRGELTRALKSGDRAKIRAYTDALTAKGDSGRQSVRMAYDAAVGIDGKGISNVAAKTFAANIISKHGAAYKDNNRAMYEVANSINSAVEQNGVLVAGQGDNSGVIGAGGVLMTTANYAMGSGLKKLLGKTKSATLVGMDDKAFEETFLGGQEYGKENTRVDMGKIEEILGNPDALRELRDNAYVALQNATDKETTRAIYLRQIVGNYQPDPRRVTVVNDSPNNRRPPTTKHRRR